MSKFAIGTILLSILLLVGGAFLFGSNDSSTVNNKSLTYSSFDKEKPSAQINKSIFDMGKIKVNDTKSRDFEIKNVGSRPLQLFNITSSCGCTVGKVIYKGKESREYGMHSKNNDIFEIEPNTVVTIRVIYRPFQMPVYGYVEREVYLSTNDPANSKLIFKVTSVVE